MTNAHLSDWEIEELILASKKPSGAESREHSIKLESNGTSGKTVLVARPWQHLESCDFCSSRKDRLQELLLLYRNDAIQRTDAVLQKQGVSAFSLKGRKEGLLHSWRWGALQLGLALVLLLAVLVPLFQRHQQMREQHQAQIAGDNLLLEQVDEEVNSSVPHPLESLTNLVVANENTDPNQ